MRVAWLVIAHHQPRLVARTAALLAHPDTTMLVHVDAKAPADAFVSALGDRARLVTPRIRVSWGAFSLVEVTVRLLREALDAGADRVQLLSSSCFPVRPVHAILDTLAAEREWLTVNEPLLGSDFEWWVRERHLGDRIDLQRAERSRAYRVVRTAIGLVRPRPWPFRDLVPYKGWHWCALTAPCARWLVDFYDTRGDVSAYLRQARIPEEIWLPTAVMASPYAGRVSHRLVTGVRSGTHFVTWSEGRPETLREHHRDAIARSGACFARKVVEGPSDALLDALEGQFRSVAVPITPT